MDTKLFKKLDGAAWELPTSYNRKMKVPVRIIATEKLLEDMEEGVVEQAVNVSNLPGLAGYVCVMPDAHFGYGFPVGGVAAFDLDTGIISPGGIGFDINCGMRLLVTNLTEADVRPKIQRLVDELFRAVPTGVGAAGAIRLNEDEFKEVMVKGAAWVVEKGFGWPEDLEHIEEKGAIPGADPEAVSERAIKRGINQLGTLGSGNHYLEVQRVDTIFDPKKATEWGISKTGQVAIMIHCGSRGFGHQIGTDYLNTFGLAMKKYGIEVNDAQLACAPIDSLEGKRYFAGMAAAANSAFANRQFIAHKVREVFASVFGKSAQELGMKLVYDVAHNIAKVEEYKSVNRKSSTVNRKLLVHRKGATRAYPGQPVIIGGSMETGSYLLVGTQAAMEKTFGSTAHGSGRTMSRTKAKGMVRGDVLQAKMKQEGIYVKTASYSGLAEEAGFAYKDINEIVKTVSLADISQPVASFKPLGNIKG